MNAQDHMNDIAKSLGLPEIKFDQNGCARLLFDGSIAVNFENDESMQYLHLYSELGELPVFNKESTYKALLEANLLGIQTRGATLGIDPDMGQVVLSRSVLIEEVSPVTFSRLLEGFIVCAEAWQQALKEGFGGQQERRSAAFSGGMDQGILA